MKEVEKKELNDLKKKFTAVGFQNMEPEDRKRYSELRNYERREGRLEREFTEGRSVYQEKQEGVKPIKFTEQDRNHFMGGGAILGLLVIGSLYGVGGAILGLFVGALAGRTMAEILSSRGRGN